MRIGSRKQIPPRTILYGVQDLGTVFLSRLQLLWLRLPAVVYFFCGIKPRLCVYLRKSYSVRLGDFDI
jgi:hypothetical protein